MLPRFNQLSRPQLEQMSIAGQQILECYRLLQKSNTNIVAEVLKGGGEFYEWDHYPKGDVYDIETHSQYYYHAHPPEDREIKWGPEHGHFHTFLRPKGMPPTAKPAPLKDYAPPKDADDGLTHYIGISMNTAGYPVRLFTTNRWVTGEVWYDAETVSSLLDYFNMDLLYPSWPVNIWLTSMMQLYRPQIIELLSERDQKISELETKYPEENIYEDRRHDITSVLAIDIAEQIQHVQLALSEV